MKVGVTGGYGFIGGHLVKRLLKEGHEVVVLDNMRRPQHRLRRHPRLKVHVGDISQETDLGVFQDCEVIVNLAAESSVLRAEANADYAWEYNTNGVAKLATFCLKNKVRLIQASSREVYGEVAKLPVTESSPLAAKNVYGRTKAMAEELLLTNRAQSNLPVTILRFSNVIGTHDADRLLPLWLTAASKGETLQVFGGDQVIDFIPVELAVEAILFSLSNKPFGPINIGSGTSFSIRALAEQLKEIYPQLKLSFQPARAIEVTSFQADIRKMLELGLTPKISFKRYLQKLAHYYR